MSATGYHHKLSRPGCPSFLDGVLALNWSQPDESTLTALARLVSWASNFQGGCARSSAIITNSWAGGRSGPMGQKLGGVNVRGVVAMAESEA